MVREVLWLAIAVFSLQLLLFLSACTSSGQRDVGVASLDGAQEMHDIPMITDPSNLDGTSSREPPIETEMVANNLSAVPLTDEEITTKFATCMRGHGFDIPDPEMNADGTVDLQTLRQNIFQDRNFDSQNASSREAVQECIPLLQGATFGPRPTGEDEVELQDTLLEFAQCLRDNGLVVPDPNFSNGVRGAMRPLIQGLDVADPVIGEMIDLCSQQIFGASRGARGSGPPGGGR